MLHCQEYEQTTEENHNDSNYTDEEWSAYYDSLEERVSNMAYDIAGIIRSICSEMEEDCYNEEYYGDWEDIYSEACDILSDCES